MPKGLRRSSSDQSILTTNVKPRWLEWVQKIRIILSNIMPKSKNCTSIHVFYVLAPKTNSSYICNLFVVNNTENHFFQSSLYSSRELNLESCEHNATGSEHFKLPEFPPQKYDYLFALSYVVVKYRLLHF